MTYLDGLKERHTEKCLEQTALACAQQAWYLALFPGCCRACAGWGGWVSWYNPGGSGEPAGYLQDVALCERCLGAGECPRCASPIDIESDGPCGMCGWTWRGGGMPCLPECLCWMQGLLEGDATLDKSLKEWDELIRQEQGTVVLPETLLGLPVVEWENPPDWKDEEGNIRMALGPSLLSDKQEDK